MAGKSSSHLPYHAEDGGAFRHVPDHYCTLKPFTFLFSKGFPILLYHNIGRAAFVARRKGMFVSRRLFVEQLTELKEAGFEFGSLGQPNGERKVIISFDDGYVSCYEHAMRLLQDFRCNAIQFVATSRIGKTNNWDRNREPIMNESQIRDCLAAGHLIGSHSVSHRDLTRLSRQDANREIFDSKKRLEDAFGSPVSHFSYPYGAWNERTEQTVREAGYATAVTTEFGINDNGTNRYRLRRISAYSSLWDSFCALVKARRK